MAINPMAVEGQIEGSFEFGLGQALYESLMMDKGQVVNANFMDYRIPVASDMPDMDSIIVESHDPNGPYGAKEAAESIHPAAIAAIANAIAHAANIRPKDLPITPEKIFRLLRKKS
jgi:4-hydroxybenzoyl-CoA reductase subunit alpha